jgi:hypothetical protein
MKYGVVKNGKVLFKYGFLEDQSANIAKVKNSVALPLEELPGKGAVTFVVLADKITMQYEANEECLLKLFTFEPFTVSETMQAFLSKHFKDSEKVKKVGKKEVRTFTLRTQEFKVLREKVWARWRVFTSEFIDTKFAFDDDNSESGISLTDLILYNFFGNDWPIQTKTGKRPLSNAGITQIKNEIKQTLKDKRDLVESKCMPATNDMQGYWTALAGSEAWIERGEL